MPRKIALLFSLAFGLQSGMSQVTIRDSLPADNAYTHEIRCDVPGDNGILSISLARDSTVSAFHYSNHPLQGGNCEIQADRNVPQGNYGPAPIWMDSNSLTKIKILVYDGYDWSEQPFKVRIKVGRFPEIAFSGPTQTLCTGSAKVPHKILIRRSPQGWVCKVPK